MAGRLSAASNPGGARRVIPLTQEDRDWERVAPRQISKAQWRQLEHHAAEILQNWVGYIAHDRIIGISKLTQAVRLYARRFTLQERMGRQIIRSLERILDAHGVAVYLDATHLCMQMRGVREQEATCRTAVGPPAANG